MRLLPLCLTLAVAGCGGAEVAQPKNPLDDAPPLERGSHLDPTVPVPVESKPRTIDKEQTKVVLERAAKNAATCVDVVPGDYPRGKVTIAVTVSGAGRATKAAATAPWEGAPIGQCITRAFVGQIVPPFDGDDVVVDQVVELKEAPPAPTPTKGTRKR